MNRKIAFLGLISLLIIAFSACQPTPENQPVVNKGNLEEKIIEKTIETKQPELSETGNVEETEDIVTWKESYVDEKGIFKVNIDARVIQPDATTFPVARMELSQFSDEQLDKVVKTFFSNNPIYDGNIPLTKSEWEQLIIKARAKAQESGLKSDEDYITQLENGYNSAPETTKLVQIEPVWQGTSGKKTVSLMQLKDGDKRANINGISSNNESSYIEYGVKSEIYLPSEKLTDIPKGCILTPQKAEEMALEVTGKLGLQDYKIVSKVTGGLLQDLAMMDISKEKQCYIFYLSKTINGIPFTYANWSEGEYMSDEKPYAPPVNQEIMEVHINDNGIIYFRWKNPYEKKDYISDNVELLDLDEIKNIFMDQMKRVGQGRNELYGMNGKTDDTINIEKVELGMMITIDKDKPNQFLSIPVWDFFASSSEVGKETNYSILTISAIDGSIINRNLGY